ncbi:MAG: radical SAM protein [Candidatus Woesearchaeota archaeon]
MKPKTKLLLIHPSNPKGRTYSSIPPLCLVTLASLTPEKKYDISVADERFEKIDFSRKYDLVGISANTLTVTRAYELARIFRSKGSKVIIGGVHPSTLPEEARKHCDSLVTGEAEEIWQGILEDFEKGRLRKRYRGGFIDMKNFPRLKSKFFKKYYIVPVTQATRGCPYGCEFCIVRVFNGGRIRKRPVDDVIADIKSINKNNRLKMFGFVDDNLFADRKYAIELFRKMKPLGLKWSVQAPVHLAFDDELLRHAKEAGCKLLWIGFESLNQESLKSVKKHNTAKRFEDAIKRFKDAGMLIRGLFIFGLDGDRKGGLMSTIRFAIKNNLDGIYLHILRPLPGTILFKRLKDEGRITTYDWSKYEDCVIKPKRMSQKELVDEMHEAYREFYSIRSIIRRMRGIRSLSNSIIYFYFSIRGWMNTRRGVYTHDYVEG